MTDWGASSESARVRTGSVVSSRLGWWASQTIACITPRDRAVHTISGRLLWLAGLTMSSVPGDRTSLMLSSLTWFSCASSSICGGVG
jgi:hypothetical protein